MAKCVGYLLYEYQGLRAVGLTTNYQSELLTFKLISIRDYVRKYKNCSRERTNRLSFEKCYHITLTFIPLLPEGINGYMEKQLRRQSARNNNKWIKRDEESVTLEVLVRYRFHSVSFIILPQQWYVRMTLEDKEEGRDAAQEMI